MLRLRLISSCIGLFLVVTSAQAYQVKVEKLAEGAPEELAQPIRDVLAPEGLRILDAEGKPWIDLWFLKAVPTSKKPAGKEGNTLYPFLNMGDLVGAAHFHHEGFDYRDQEILEGTYSLRYGLQPVNGDHLGVSLYRDYFLLVPAELDQKVEPIAEEDLNLDSSDAAGTNHPAVYMLMPVPEAVEQLPAVVVDDQNKRTGVAFEVPVQAEGEDKPTQVKMQLIVIGTGPT